MQYAIISSALMWLLLVIVSPSSQGDPINEPARSPPGSGSSGEALSSAPDAPAQVQGPEDDKRAWRDLQGGWGKRGWQDLQGGWGKRGWQDLQGGWGKRGWQDLQGGWGKRGWQDLQGGWGKRGWQDLQQAGWGKRGWQDLQAGWGKRGWQDLQIPPLRMPGLYSDTTTINFPLRNAQAFIVEKFNMAGSSFGIPLFIPQGGWGKRAWDDLRPMWGKRTWDKFHGSWGKRDSDFDFENNSMDDDTLPEELAEEDDGEEMKRAWSSLKGGWGKRAADWANFRGSWGKRDPGWNNLKGLWGKRSDTNWNRLSAAWGKRSIGGETGIKEEQGRATSSSEE